MFHPGVEEDLDAVVAHYVALDPALPGRFRARLLEQVERIEQVPDSGALLFETYRRAVLRRFPHMAVYLVGHDRLELLVVVDVRRDPAWIEATIAERADTQRVRKQSARSPAEPDERR
ncbi:MAG: type II toxin-antitoxin system RelE/ParE family toxin [Georgenia sp.]